MSYSVKNTFAPFLSLFASAGTLVCCALPALFVSLGMGAALAGLVGAAPWLIWLSKYKLWVFGFSAVMILFAGWMQWRARNLPCPVDPQQAKACTTLRRLSWAVWGLSVIAYITGFFFAFIAPEILF